MFSFELKSALGGIEINTISPVHFGDYMLKSALGGIEIRNYIVVSFNQLLVKISPWRD